MSESSVAKTPVREGAGADRSDSATPSPLDEGSDAPLDSKEDAFLRAAAEMPEVGPSGSDPNRIGTMISKYEILEEIGRGGMGIVYAAEDQKLRRRVAIKLLPKKFAGDEERRRRFLREARATSTISHANVATVFDVDETEDGSIYIAMEHTQGRTLRSLLHKGALDVHEAVRIGREVLAGLSKAHEVGIIHRDIKPDNVMVTPEGSVKLLDFGLAKPIGTRETLYGQKASQSDFVTLEGRVMGTPSYMSPEQARGEPVDERSDIYTFGVLFYEMLTARRPFAAKNIATLLNAIDRETPPKPSALNPRVHRSLERVVERCLQKDPALRFAKCEEVLCALDRAARAPGVARAAVLALVLLLAAAGVTAAAWLRSSPAGAALPAPEPPTNAAPTVVPTTARAALPPVASQPTTSEAASAAKTSVASPASIPSPAPRPGEKHGASAAPRAAPPPQASGTSPYSEW